MVNFDEIIALAMKEGESIEEIAKAMTNALNEASKPKITPRDAYLNELRDQVKDAADDDAFGLSDAIAALALCVVEKHDNWSLEGIEVFVNCITDQVAMIEETIDKVEHGGDFMDVLVDYLVDTLQNKSKSSKEESDCTCGSQCHRSDDEKLNMFLKNLGI